MTSQTSLFEPPPAAPETACPVPPRDTARLATQLLRVRELMADGRWWTLAHLALAVGASEAGVSARIRDLRKHPYHLRVVRERLPHSTLYRYRVASARQEAA